MEKTPEYIDFLKTRISPNVKPEIAKLMIEYALDPEEHSKTYQKIHDYVFERKTPDPNPKIFLVISQTGGGKSGLTSQIMEKYPNTVVIDSDAFKAFNPRRKEITEKYPTLYGYLTGIDAYLHRDEIYNEALEKGYNVLIEIAPSIKERLFNIDFDELEKYGYQVHANVLAVSKINSLLSVHERFEGQIEAKMDSPKLTDLKRAIESYDAVELVLKDLIDMKDINLSLWKRNPDGEVLEGEEMPRSKFITDDKLEALECLKEARKEDEELTIKTAQERIDLVKKQMRERKAPVEQRAQFEKIEQMIM